MLRQSLQNKASNTDLHQPQPPNLRPPPSPSALPIIAVSLVSIQVPPPCQHRQDQTAHRKKKTAVIEHRPGLVAVSDPPVHDQPLLRPTTASRSASNAVSTHTLRLPGQAIFQSVILHPFLQLDQYLIFLVYLSPHLPYPHLQSNASRSQHQIFSSAEVVTPPVTPLALNVLHDRGASFQILNPHRSLQVSRNYTPGLEQQIYSNPFSTDSEFSKMSPMPKLFKRPRSKSEKSLNCSTTSRLSDIPASPPMSPTETLSMIHRSQSGTPVVVPELPASWGRFYQAGEGNPHSPLRNTSSIFNSSKIPPGPPPIDEAEIGGKFPSLSNGPGIERRVFIDPIYKRPQYLGPPAGRPNHRRSISLDRYEHPVLEPRLRTGPPTFLDAALYNGEGSQQRPMASEQSNPQDFPQFFYEEFRQDKSTARGVLEGYCGKQARVETKAVEGGKDALQDSNVEIDPRLSQWAWSPAASICLPSSPTKEAPKKAHPLFPSEPPTAPPSTPLPHLPVHLPDSQARPYHHNSPTTENSPTSYGNTRNLLALSPSPRDFTNVRTGTMGRLPVPPGSSISTSIADSMLDRLLADSDSNNGLTTPPRPQGRLSFEHLETSDHEAIDPGPGTSQSSSVLSAARPGGPGIMRSGTPPLLFGSRAIGRGDSSVTTHQSSIQINRRLAMAARSVGLRGASRLEQAVSSEEDEEDWETDADGRGSSRRRLGDVEAAAGAGSSLADFSDSGSSIFPNQNATGPPTYRHPAPLPSAHSHPFGGLPPVIGSSDKSDVKGSRSPPPVPMRSPARKMVSSNVKVNVSRPTFTHLGNEEWQTVDGGSDDEMQLPNRKGSFAKVTVLGDRGNLTGTPQGTGTREVGSSLADESSPLDALDAQAAKAQHRNTIDSSLDPVRANAPGNFQELISQHPIFRTDLDEELSEDNFGSVPSEDLSPEIRRHRQQLINNSLLPRLPTPPFTQPKRFSVPSHLLQSSSSGNMVMLTRSPRLRPQDDGMSGDIPTPFSLDYQEATASRLVFEQPRLVSMGPSTRTRATSLPRPEATASRMASEQSRLFTDSAASSSALHTGRGRTQDRPEHRARSQPRPETRNANTMPGTANATPQSANAMPPPPRPQQWTGPYGDFIREHRVPVEHPRRPIPAWRADARAESLHLHRLPRPIGLDMDRREKELSRVFFALCCLIFPTLIIYGHGYLDGAMRQVSKGDFQGFRAQEKTIAIFLGYGLLFPLALGLAHVFWK